MRILMKPRMQRKLLYEYKSLKDFTWSKMAYELNVSESMLQEWTLENCLLPKSIYLRLDPTNKYEKFILETKPENWGQRKGGKLSCGNTKIIKKVKYSIPVAEFIGILLGDGNIYVNRKFGIYSIRVASNQLDEQDYAHFIAQLAQKIFGIKPRFKFHNNSIYVCLESREAVKALCNLGLIAGNKIKKKIGIPNWIWRNKEYLRACIRGLIDTDGSVYRLSRKDPQYIRIGFKALNNRLLKDVHNGFTRLSLFSSKPNKYGNIFITRKADVKKYVEKTGFHNPKHIARLRILAP